MKYEKLNFCIYFYIVNRKHWLIYFIPDGFRYLELKGQIKYEIRICFGLLNWSSNKMNGKQMCSSRIIVKSGKKKKKNKLIKKSITLIENIGS